MSTEEKNQNSERSTQLPFCPYCMTPVSPGETCPVCHLKQGSYVPASHHLPPGTVLAGRYLIGRVLGEGGFGITYIGCDLRLEMKVAVKEYFPVDQVSRHAEMGTAVIAHVTREDGKSYSDGIKRFLREARTLARMEKQPEIVTVRDFFEGNNTAYIVMEYVDGTSFRELMEQKGGKIPAAELLPVIEPLFSALTALHNAGLIHRDISPDNIMLERGQVRLLDFGCARESAGGSATMTVSLKQGFSPIEQYQRKNQGPWTDVYALAATIYCCLTGNVPPSSLDRLLDDEVVPVRRLGVDLTPGQQKALMKGMALQPRNRYRTMEEFHQGLYHPVEPWEDPTRPQQEEAPAPEILPEEEPEPEEEPKQEETAGGQAEAHLAQASEDIPPEPAEEPADVPEVHEEKQAGRTIPKRNVLIAVGAVVLLILILAVCLWSLGRGKTEDDSEVNSTAEGAGEDTDSYRIQVSDDSREEEENSGEDAEFPYSESEILYSGEDGDLHWQVYEDGILYVSGDGNVNGDPDWQEYQEEITRGYAVISGCSDLSGLFSNLTMLEDFTFVSLSTWDGTEISADELFSNCPALEQVIFQDTDLSGVSSMNRAFAGCTSLMSLDLCDLSLSNVTAAEGMLEDCISLAALMLDPGFPSAALPVSNGRTWTDSNLNTCRQTAAGAEERMVYAASGRVRHSGISGDLLWVIDQDSLLTIAGRGDFDGNNKGWDAYDDEVTAARVYADHCVDLSSMFSGMSGLRTCDFGTSWFDSASEDELRMTDVFYGCTSLEEVSFNRLDTTGVAAYGMLFQDCTSLRTVDLSALDCSNAWATDYLFSGCTSLTELDFTGFDCVNATLAGNMLEGCTSLEQVTVPANFAPRTSMVTLLPGPGDGFWVSSDGEICTEIARGEDHEITYLRCGAAMEQGNSGDLLWIIDESGLLTVVGRGDGGTPDWEEYSDLVTAGRMCVSDCTDMSDMYCSMDRMVTFDFVNSSFAEDAPEACMTDLFGGCTALEQVDFGTLNTAGVVSFEAMFRDCISLRTVDLSAADSSGARTIDYLFSGCTSLTELDFTGFDCTYADSSEDMLEGCTSLGQVTVPAGFASMAEQEITLPDPGEGIWVCSDGAVCTEIARGADHEIIYLRCGSVVEQGVFGELLWVIDDTGMLTITGVGNYDADGNLVLDEASMGPEIEEYMDWQDYLGLVSDVRVFLTN